MPKERQIWSYERNCADENENKSLCGTNWSLMRLPKTIINKPKEMYADLVSKTYN